MHSRFVFRTWLKLLGLLLLLMACSLTQSAPPPPAPGGAPSQGEAPSGSQNGNLQITFTAAPQQIAPGGCATLQWQVSGPHFAVLLNGEQVTDQGSKQVCPPETRNFLLQVDTGDTMAERQVTVQVGAGAPPPPAGGSGGTAQGGAPPATPPAGPPHTTPPTAPPPPPAATPAGGPAPTETPSALATIPVAKLLVLSFYGQAASAAWSNGSGVSLPFPGADNDNRGFARPADNVLLEDGHKYNGVLETHPEWINTGAIAGTYPAVALPNNAHFHAQIGFIAQAGGSCGAGEADFELWGGGPGMYLLLGSWHKKCDGHLQTVDVDLSSSAGQNLYFQLQVEAAENSAQDWAVWVQPEVSVP